MFSIVFWFFVAWFARNIEAECPPIVSRNEWDAVKPRHRDYLTVPLDLIVIQHTVTESCSDDRSCAKIVKDLQKTHIEEAVLWDIGPSFLVGGNGKLYEGRGWHHVAIHTPGFNNQSIGIAFIGNFNNQEPSPSALKAVRNLIECGVDEEILTTSHKVVAHNQLVPTESPGNKLANIIKSWTDWLPDVSEIRKRADALEYQLTDLESKIENNLVLNTPRQIDFLYNQRDGITKIVDNNNKLASGTMEAMETTSSAMNKQFRLFHENMAKQFNKDRRQAEVAFAALPVIPGAEKCAKLLRDKLKTHFDKTEIKAKQCADERFDIIDNMMNNLRTLSTNAISYTNIAEDKTKNCTEMNYGIKSKSEECLHSVNDALENTSRTFEFQRNKEMDAISTFMTQLPAALDRCTKNFLESAA